MSVEIRLLGRFEVLADGERCPSDPWGRRHAAALVKVLALSRHRSLHREQLLDVLWPDLALEEAAPRLHKAAHYARHGFPDPGAAVVLRGDTVALLPDVAVTVDAVEFEAAALRAVEDGTPEAAAAALARYDGTLLPDDLYEPWTEQPRERLALLHQQLLRQARCWEQVLEADPADEEAHVALMSAHLDAGDRTSALRQFERMERALRLELGIPPSAEAVALRDRAAAEPAAGQVPAQRNGGGGLLGREAHQRRLHELLAAAEGGRGATVLLAGPPGAGKSALLRWLVTEARARGWQTGVGAAAKIEGAWPFAPALEAIADLCRAHPALLDGLDERYRGELERALALRVVADAEGGGHQRLFVAAAALLRVAAHAAGVLLVVDDAHEADDASLRLLHHLARGAAGERVVTVLAHRDPADNPRLEELRASLTRRDAAVSLPVGPLERPALEALLRADAPELPSAAAEQVWQLSGGLPFAALELARAADGHLPDRPGAGFLARLQRGTRELLARVAVTGLVFDTDEFVALCGLPDEQAYARLDDAMTARVIERTGSGYRFRHALLREELLAALPPAHRRALHREAAERLAALGASPARVGHHLLEAGAPSEAAPHLLAAARTAAGLGAYRDALDLVEPVVDGAEGTIRGELAVLRGDLLAAMGDPTAVAAYRDAARLTTGEGHRRARAGLARAATLAGDLDTARDALEGVELTGGPADAAVLLARGMVAYFRGDLDSAWRTAEQARGLVVTGDEGWQLLELIGLQGLLAHSRGEWFERLGLELEYGRDAPRVATAVFDGHLCVAEYLLYGPTPYPRVIQLARGLRQTAQRAGVPRADAFAAAVVGEAALLSGDLDLAERELREAVDLHRDIGGRAGEAHCLQRLAEVRLARGDRAGARALCERAVPLARWSTVAMHLLQRVFGTLICAADGPAAAHETVARAEDVMDSDDFCPFCTVMLAVPAATACADDGDDDDAERWLQLAERSAGLWDGTAWQAAVCEARAHLARARGEGSTARCLAEEAARGFDAVGQPLDAARCRDFERLLSDAAAGVGPS